MTHAGLIKLLGGYVALAALLKVEPKRVHNWTRPYRGIPGIAWPQIMGLAADRAILVAALADIQPNPVERSLSKAALRRLARAKKAVTREAASASAGS